MIFSLNSRTPFGVMMASCALGLLYFGYAHILFGLTYFAAIYDLVFMRIKLKINYITIIIFGLLLFAITLYAHLLYYSMPYLMVKIVLIALTSDAFQYWTGTRLGRNKIGWISPNKTYEGYIVGWMTTYIVFVLCTYSLCIMHNNSNSNSCSWINVSYDVCFIYWLGVVGGLISSLFKRLIRIKDYSNIMGPHGGWTDRIDSTVLPLIFHYYLTSEY